MALPVDVLRRGYAGLLRPALFRVGGGDPEAAHQFAVRALAGVASLPLAGAATRALVGRAASPTRVAGIDFPGVVGVAAGLDKDGAAARAWAGLGFGFAELGTVTAHGQPGNPAPRMFRLRDSRAIINRMGFNNHGAAALAARLERWGVRRGQATLGLPLGISLGKTKATPLGDAVADYLASFALLRPYADYIAVNVSSPNTPGLRELQRADFLGELARALVAEAGGVPVFVKVAPDLADADLDAVLGVAHETGVAGLIVGNTTLARAGLAAADLARAAEAGGLSGAPLTARARQLVGRVARATDLPVMGVGGIMTPADGLALLDAGAALVQVYTGFIYAGPALVAGIDRAARTRAASRPAAR